MYKNIGTKDLILYEVFQQFTKTYYDAIITSYNSIVGGNIDTSKLSTSDLLDLCYCVADEIEFKKEKENASNN